MSHSSAIPSACGHRVCYVSTGHNLLFSGINACAAFRASARMFLPGANAVADSKFFPARDAMVYLAGRYVALHMSLATGALVYVECRLRRGHVACCSLSALSRHYLGTSRASSEPPQTAGRRFAALRSVLPMTRVAVHRCRVRPPGRSSGAPRQDRITAMISGAIRDSMSGTTLNAACAYPNTRSMGMWVCRPVESKSQTPAGRGPGPGPRPRPPRRRVGGMALKQEVNLESAPNNE